MINPKAYLNKKIFTNKIEMIPNRNGFGEGVLEAGKANKDVVALTADLAESTRMHYFRDAFPERFVECGVAEQNMMGVAAGMALNGKIPFMGSYATFCPGRSWDQLRVSVCYNNINVNVTGAHSGLSVGPDGATHQALEDIAITRVLPNLVVMAPSDYHEAKKCALASAKHDGPVYIRFSRPKMPSYTTAKTPFKIGRAELFWDSGDDVTIIGCGPLVYECLLAARALEKKHKVGVKVVNLHTIKPLDGKMLMKMAKATKAFVVVEEHQVHGGLYGAVAEWVCNNYPLPIENVGMPDSFGQSGEPQELLEHYEMTAPFIMKKVLKVIERK